MKAAAALAVRPGLAAAVIYAAVAILFLAPALLPGKTLSSSDTLWFDPPWVASKPPELSVPSNEDLGDAPQYLQPYLRRSASEIPDVPLWNPYIMGGRPFHANGQSALFGPYTWPAYLLPFWTAMSWIGVLKLWVAAFGTFLLGRSLGMRFAGALLAGLIFALNLKLVTWLIYPAMGVWTWYPWLLFCADRFVKRRDLLAGTALAAVVAVQFLTGHLESSFHGLVLTTVFFAFRLWQARRPDAPAMANLVRPLIGFVGAIAAGAAVAAVSLIPLGELLVLSADFVDRRGKSIDDSLPLKEAIGIFMPDWWGRPTQTPLRPILLERAMYVGALPLVLSIAALFLRPTRLRLAVALFGAVSLAVVLGIPPFLQVVTRLPVFDSGHNTRLIVFPILAVALLAGWGLDELTSARGHTKRRVALVLALSAALVITPLLIVVVGSTNALAKLPEGLRIAWLFEDPPGRFHDPQGQDVIRASALIIWLAVSGAAVLLLALRFGRRLGATAFVAFAVLLLCIDLFRIGMGQNPAIDRKFADVPKTGAIRFLERQSPARFVSTSEIPDNAIPLQYRLYEARGYDLPILRRYDRLWRREVIPGAPSVAASFIDIPLRLREVTPRALRTLRLLGVTHLLGPKTVEPSAPPFNRLLHVPALRVGGLSLVYDGADARVYRLSGALPRAFVVGAQTAVGDEAAALAAITRPEFDARRTAITEQKIRGIPSGAAAAARGSAQIVRYEPERVVVRAASAGPALVVLGDNDFPGWNAQVDGQDAPIERVDYLFRGVRVGPGSHTVEFRYQPLSWRVGWVVSVVALVGLMLALVLGLRRRRRQAAQVEPRESSGREGARPRAHGYVAPMRQPWMSVVVPAYNEESAIADTVSAILAWLDERSRPYEVIVVDNASEDGTALALEPLLDGKRVLLVHNETNRGKGFSVRRGMLEANGELRLLCDADCAPSLASLPAMLTAIEQADVAVGSRLAVGAQVARQQPMRRRIVGWPFIALTRGLMWEPTRDIYCGFKLWRAHAAQAVFSRQQLDGWVFDAEALAIARRLGFRIREVGIVWTDRETSKLSISKTLLPAIRELLAARRSVRRLTRNTPSIAPELVAEHPESSA
jgi:hypothetical protein